MSTPPPELILASTSETRRQILDTLGLKYRIVAPEFDEHTHPPGVTPDVLAETLALGKARSVARRFEEALVLGADQILTVEGEIFRKPENAEQARAQLEKLNGKSHTLLTGLALLCEKSHALRVSHEVTRLTMRHFDSAELDAYIALGEWKGCVGSYRVEGQGIKLFERIEGDITNARGLPVVRLCSALRELGAALPMMGLDAVLLGGALLPVGMWGLYHWGGASTSVLLLAFQVGLNLPHYFQTYSLTYLNPELRRREALRLTATVGVAVTFPVAAILMGAVALKWALAFVALWAFLHITQQTRGLAGLYLRRADDAAIRKPLLAFLFLSTAAVAAGRVAAYGLTLSGDALELARPVTVALAAAATVALGFALTRFTRAHLPAVALVVLHSAVMALSMSVTNLSVALALATSWHALQYLGLTFAVQRRLPETFLFPRLARSEAVGFFGIALGFGLGAAALGAALPAPWGQAVYLPLLLVHYLSDAWLWRPEQNPELRSWLKPLASRA